MSIKKDSVQEQALSIIENYKKLSVIITLFNKNTSADNIDNIEKYIAEEYAKILSVYYDYNIILA